MSSNLTDAAGYYRAPAEPVKRKLLVAPTP